MVMEFTTFIQNLNTEVRRARTLHRGILGDKSPGTASGTSVGCWKHQEYYPGREIPASMISKWKSHLESSPCTNEARACM
jgi:hypothetical protein